MVNLESLLKDVDFGTLPPEWTTNDLARFSASKRLWDYQQRALRHALIALWKYQTGGETTAERKEAFARWYELNDIRPGGVEAGKAANVRLLDDYYPLEGGKLPYRHLVNRMNFWMATGSGKTLVIVKLLELLRSLMTREALPARDVLVLTHREDLLRQLRDHVAEYNAGSNGLHIRLRDLKEYPDVKRAGRSLLGHEEMTVFTYRSDNLSDEQKDRIIDFRNYDNNGRWYVLLDEAHKGDKDDSKRQHIYSILSRDGFLFNFSATFTDPRDKLTTAAQFNLSDFILAGYGKHIAILKQENRAFKDKEDYTGDEKQRIVLQSLLMLAYVARMREKLVEAAEASYYHRPLLIALVNSVNVEDADLKLFFGQLERIGRGAVDGAAFEQAKSELFEELQGKPEWLYESERFEVDYSVFNDLTLADVLRLVFNAEAPGAIEVLTRPSNDRELAFKLKNADAPFALIRIGNTAEWLKNFLVDSEVIKGFDDEGYFERLNRDDNSINLLLGSRSFYEGWDSNRPNVITYVNIGTGTDAKKFILQSVGRGVRVEPRPNQRKRMASLFNAGIETEFVYETVKPYLPAVESLFIFGTSRAALEKVLGELSGQSTEEAGQPLALVVNDAAAGRPLLIPVYRQAGRRMMEQREVRKFELLSDELASLRQYLGYLDDDRLLLAHHGLTPKQIGRLRRSVANSADYFSTAGGRRYGRMDILLSRLSTYLDIIPRDLDGFKPLEDEINHFLHIQVKLEDISELQRKIAAVQAYEDPNVGLVRLQAELTAGKMTVEAFGKAAMALGQTKNYDTFTPSRKSTLTIKHLAAHYYLPVLLSDDEKIDYINYVIKVESEVRFVNQLDEYVRRDDSLFNRFDWWMFCRNDEKRDKVVIPYYDSSLNTIREFHPDFIFWLKADGDDYTILFVDPKGMKQTDYQYKIDGYRALFEDETGKPRVFRHEGLDVRVALAMHTADANQAPDGYRPYWYDTPEGILHRIL
jgi:superfamily II DNA or RNA helicase